MTAPLLGNMSREEYMQKRVHPRLHAQAAGLTDRQLTDLGVLDFTKQFSGIAAMLGPAGPGGLFGPGGREAYMQQHVHRKLHTQAALLVDEDLLELGRLSFNEQFGIFEGGIGQAQEPASTAETGGQHLDGDFFGGASRETYMMQHVHRKLHTKAATLSDAELLTLGKLSFNEQFPALSAEGDQPPLAAAPGGCSGGDLFMGQGRDGYMAARVHRRLHAQAAALSDEQLSQLGRLSFNEQFPALGVDGEAVAMTSGAIGAPPVVPAQRPGLAGDPFMGQGREGYMAARVHRKLHTQAATLSDSDLLALGKLSFNEQFPALGLDGGATPVATPMPSPRQPIGQPIGGDLFQGQGRDAYMQGRVHRKLHAQAAILSDQDLFDLGQRSFNQQFTVLETMPVPMAQPVAQPVVQPVRVDPFGGLGRDGYMQQRVHRRLHPKAAMLTDEELAELGGLSFNEQFPALEHVEVVATPVASSPSGNTGVFGGMTRDAYMQARIHRRLHAQAAQLSDAQLSELGQLSFNQQFPYVEELPPIVAPTPKAAPVVMPRPDPFQGMGRDAYMQQRVHRRLHSRALTLSDEALLDLGRLSFNEQFPALEHITPVVVPVAPQVVPAAPQVVPARMRSPSSSSLFGGLDREAYMHQRVHRKLHAQAMALNDDRLLELGKLSFNQQFPFLESLAGALEVEAALSSSSADLFGQVGRDGYMQNRVHRKLHNRALALSDKELYELGKLSFNEQFPALDNLDGVLA